MTISTKVWPRDDDRAGVTGEAGSGGGVVILACRASNAVEGDGHIDRTGRFIVGDAERPGVGGGAGVRLEGVGIGGGDSECQDVVAEDRAGAAGWGDAATAPGGGEVVEIDKEGLVGFGRRRRRGR